MNDEFVTPRRDDADRGDSAQRKSPRGVLIALLKVIIGLLMMILLLSQTVLLPIMANEAAQDDPVHAFLRIPYLLVSIAILLCFEIALASLWPLLSMTSQDRVFSGRAFRWVDLITWAVGIAAVLTAVLLVHSLYVSAGPPLFGLVLLVVLLAEVGFVLLVSVMRSLLVAATDQRNELKTVI